MKTLYVSLLIGAGLLCAGTAQADEALAKAKGCMACHKIDKSKPGPTIGPSYLDVAKRYAGQKDIEAKLVDKVLNGGSGAWEKELNAKTPMPPNKATVNLKPDEATKLVKWILSLK